MFTVTALEYSNFRKVDAHTGINMGLFDNVLEDGLHDEVVNCAVNWIKGKLGMIVVRYN